MTRRGTQAETSFKVLSEHLEAVRRVMVTSLVGRRVPLCDAEEAAQDVLVTILRCPEKYAAKLAALDKNAPYFVKAGLNAYLMRLRGERRRRERERRQDEAGRGRGDPVPEHAFSLRDLPPEVLRQLTAQQRQYLDRLTSGQQSIDQIATSTRTSPRAVKAVLDRAVTRIRQGRPDPPAPPDSREPPSA